MTDAVKARREYLDAETKALQYSEGKECLRNRIEAIIGLGSYVDDDDGLTYERASMRSAGTLLRAVAVALVHGNCIVETTDIEVVFSAADGAKACAAIAVLLEQCGDLASELRFADSKLPAKGPSGAGIPFAQGPTVAEQMSGVEPRSEAFHE
ncbi:MAG: hypothetical protein ABI548_01615 [Polyangiaceae bacterium]